MTACITGWAHSKFGRLEGETVESLIGGVVTDALENAGLDASEIDEIYLGHFNAGFSPQDFTAAPPPPRPRVTIPWLRRPTLHATRTR